MLMEARGTWKGSWPCPELPALLPLPDHQRGPVARSDAVLPEGYRRKRSGLTGSCVGEEPMGCAVWGTGESHCRKERGHRGSKENGSHLTFPLGVGQRLATEPGAPQCTEVTGKREASTDLRFHANAPGYQGRRRVLDRISQVATLAPWGLPLGPLATPSA